MNERKIHLAFVTGASSGIGMAMCRLLARKGIPLLVTGRDVAKLNVLADELRALVSVEVIAADIALENGRRSLVEKIREQAPDLIINNAGFGLYGLALTHETNALQEIVDVNISGVLQLTLEGARVLQSKGKRGTILNISSASDLIVFPCLAVYAASKAFVTQFSRSLDEEMKSYGIRILVSCPGVVDTEFRKRASGKANAKSDPHSMSVSFAAEQIWNQIMKEKQVHVFDWKTRLGVFFGRFVLPQALVSKILLHKMESIHPTNKPLT
jgi:short-subunit dehydrogenase